MTTVLISSSVGNCQNARTLVGCRALSVLRSRICNGRRKAGPGAQAIWPRETGPLDDVEGHRLPRTAAAVQDRARLCQADLLRAARGRRRAGLEPPVRRRAQ